MKKQSVKSICPICGHKYHPLGHYKPVTCGDERLVLIEANADDKIVHVYDNISGNILEFTSIAAAEQYVMDGMTSWKTVTYVKAAKFRKVPLDDFKYIVLDDDQMGG